MLTKFSSNHSNQKKPAKNYNVLNTQAAEQKYYEGENPVSKKGRAII